MTRMKKLISAALAIAMILSMTVPAFASVESESVNVMQLKNTPGFSEDNPIQMEKFPMTAMWRHMLRILGLCGFR